MQNGVRHLFLLSEPTPSLSWFSITIFVKEPISNMKIIYDPKYNIAYLALKDKDTKDTVETICLSDEVNIDIASDGTLCGIELLNANKQLKSGKKSLSFVVSDTSSGKSIRVPLRAN